MARRRSDLRLEAAADYGPGVIRGKDGRMQYVGAADVIIENRPDPDPERKHLVRGARRSITIDELFDRKVINKAMRDAANRFLDDLSMATSGGGAGIGDGIRVAPGSRDGMSERQLLAITRVRRVMNLLGINSDCVFWWVIVGNKAPRQFDERFKLRNGTGADWLRQSLQALDNHYHPPR